MPAPTPLQRIGRAAPRPILPMRHQSCLDRIIQDVGDDRLRVIVLTEDVIIKTALPQLADDAVVPRQPGDVGNCCDADIPLTYLLCANSRLPAHWGDRRTGMASVPARVPALPAHRATAGGSPRSYAPISFRAPTRRNSSPSPPPPSASRITPLARPKPRNCRHSATKSAPLPTDHES